MTLSRRDEMGALRAVAHAYRSEVAAVVTYAVTIGLGIGGAVLAAYGHTVPAVILGCVALLTACLCGLAFRAAKRWRAYAEHLDGPVERLSPSEAIIISRSGHTVESWNRLTPQQRADIRWRLGAPA